MNTSMRTVLICSSRFEEAGPGLPGFKAKRSIKPTPKALMEAIDGCRVRAEIDGTGYDCQVPRVENEACCA